MIPRMRVPMRFMFAMLLASGPVCLSQDTLPPATGAVVFLFAIAGAPASADFVVTKACPSNAAALPAGDLDDAQKVVTAIAQQMQTALLQHHVAAHLAQPNEAIAPGTLVFSGCLTGLKHGSAAARSMSVGVGGSQITTHARIYTAGPGGGETNLREYDLVTKGTNYGGGLIVGLARAKRTSVEGDGRHAADQIVNKYFADAGTIPAGTPSNAAGPE